MDNGNQLLEKLSSTFNNVLGNAIEFLPNLFAAVIILLVGWLVARLVRALVVRFISQLDVFWQRIIANKTTVQLQPRQPPTRFVGEVLFWLTILLSVVLATEILGLSIFVSWLNEIVRYLPLLISGLLIVLAGFIVSSLTRDLVTSAMTSSGMLQADAVGRLVQIVILFTAIVIGADQVGINVSFLSTISAIILAATLGSVALAFGFGARNHVANLISAHYLRRAISIGDKVRINDLQGSVIEIIDGRIALDTDQGQVLLPASIVDVHSFTIIKDE